MGTALAWVDDQLSDMALLAALRMKMSRLLSSILRVCVWNRQGFLE